MGLPGLPELPQAELMTPRPRRARLKVPPVTVFHTLEQICFIAHAAQLPGMRDLKPLASVKGISQLVILATTHMC